MPKNDPLIEEEPDDGMVMHAVIAIAPKPQKIIAAIRAIRFIWKIICPRVASAKRLKSTLRESHKLVA